MHEPGCAVRRAVADGRLPRSRYVSYRKLVGGDGDDPRPADGEPAPADPGAGRQFTCAHCGRPVPPDAAGSRHRNHCPHCLHSLHLDEVPGDRAACCVMDPVTVWVRGRGEWALVHRCRTCGRLSSNRIAGDDNEALLLSLAARPLSAPPFPLDGLAGLRAAGPSGGLGEGAGRGPVGKRGRAEGPGTGDETGRDGGLDPAGGQGD
ncbi:MAG: RNHCP domain-containing protein [Actinobacteria bacterium]|nr:RNHCP domain-containing protein [Actinomycetota bacterium]